MLPRSVNHIFLCVLIVMGLGSCRAEPEVHGTGLVIGTSLPVLGAIVDELIQEDDTVFVLLSGSGSPHNYQPLPSEILNLKKSHILILGDPELDGWIVDLVNVEVRFLSDSLESQFILSTNGFRNPHFWLDPVLIRKLVLPIAELLCQRRESACSTYHQRAHEFADTLKNLDEEISTDMSALHKRSVITSHPFFNYFLARYNLNSVITLAYNPAIEPSPAKIIKTLKAVKTTDLLGLVAHTALPDLAIILVKQETELPIVYVNPTGSLGQTYSDFIRAASKSLLGLQTN